MENLPTVSVVFPTFNEEKFILPCLWSIFNLEYASEKIEVIMADNSSQDKTVRLVESNFPSVKILKLSENLGFPAAVNRGIAQSKGDYIFITNADMVLDKNCFKELIKVGEENKDIGILGPAVYSLEKRNEIQSMGGEIVGETFEPKLIRDLSPTKVGAEAGVIEVDWVSGCGMMVKREMVEKIGPMEERFYLYYDDPDYCLRAKKAGYRVVCVPGAKFWHKGGKSSNPTIVYYLTRNKLLFWQKHRGIPLYWHYRNWRYFLTSVVNGLVSSNRTHYQSIAWGILDYYLGKFGKR